MRTTLLSDFKDYYDHAFDVKGDSFVRKKTHEMSRSDIIDFLSDKGFRVPPHGQVRNFVINMSKKATANDVEVLLDHYLMVVYENSHDHDGYGKQLILARQALEEYPTCFYTEYAGKLPSFSIKFVQIGNRRWWFKCESKNDWRSNWGETSVELLGEDPPGWAYNIPYPMFSVDFVIPSDDDWTNFWATDFNRYPNLIDLKFDRILEPEEVVDLLKQGIKKYSLD